MSDAQENGNERASRGVPPRTVLNEGGEFTPEVLTDRENKSIIDILTNNTQIILAVEPDAVFAYWYAVAFVVYNPHLQPVIGALLQNQLEYLTHILTDINPDAEKALDRMLAWYKRDHPKEGE